MFGTKTPSLLPQEAKWFYGAEQLHRVIMDHVWGLLSFRGEKPREWEKKTGDWLQSKEGSVSLCSVKHMEVSTWSLILRHTLAVFRPSIKYRRMASSLFVEWPDALLYIHSKAIKKWEAGRMIEIRLKLLAAFPKALSSTPSTSFVAQKPSVTPVIGYLMPSFGLFQQCKHMVPRHAQVKHLYT